ncbi:DUF6941 family protein [Candidatus Auribacterota bacterium]
MSNESVILPDLQFSVLCDNVIQDEQGKFSFIALFETIVAQSFPCTHSVLYVVNRWCNGYGNFTQQSRIIAPDNDTVLAEDKLVEFVLKNIEHRHTVVAKFNNLIFQSQGKYWLEVMLNNNPAIRYPLHLVKK